MNPTLDSARLSSEYDSVVGRVFDIQRFSTQDGPGIRTTVFLKGCPLHCAWCHNPEGLHPQASISYSPDRCIACGECVDACTEGCHQVGVQADLLPSHTYERRDCRSCGDCASVCPAGAMKLIGREVSVGDVLAEVLEDRPFYAHSGGGITLSGGEPLAQVDFAIALLKAARKEGLHCCVETSGYATWDRLCRLLPLVDLFLYDYKETDPERHRQYTGQTNEAILKNLHSLHDGGANIQLNCPVIPGFNDREDHLAGIAALVESLPRLRAVRLLPYHSLGSDKLKRLGLPLQLGALGKLNYETMERWLRVLRQNGVHVMN